MSSLLLCCHRIITLPYASKSPICSAGSEGLLQSPDASSALPRGSSDGSSLLRCREGWEQCLGVRRDRAGLLALCVLWGGNATREGQPGQPGCGRGAFPRSRVLRLGGSLCPSHSVPPLPLGLCVISPALRWHIPFISFISGLCLPVLSAALIPVKREAGWEDPSPFQNQVHFP